jgi:hypothetical protein
MLESNPRAKVAFKLVLIVVVVGAVLGIAGRHVAPSVPLATWLFWCGLGLVAFLLVSVLWILFNLQIGQAALRMGGTDPQWFWFNSEPRGLTALRKQWESADEQSKNERGL